MQLLFYFKALLRFYILLKYNVKYEKGLNYFKRKFYTIIAYKKITKVLYNFGQFMLHFVTQSALSQGRRS